MSHALASSDQWVYAVCVFRSKYTSEFRTMEVGLGISRLLGKGLRAELGFLCDRGWYQESSGRRVYVRSYSVGVALCLGSEDCGETFQSELKQLLRTKRSCDSAAFYDCCLNVVIGVAVYYEVTL